MNEADRLFEELGYEKEECTDGIRYNKQSIEYIKNIFFIYEYKKICQFMYRIWDNKKTEYEFVTNNVQELKAINMVCKELGWLDE